MGFCYKRHSEPKRLGDHAGWPGWRADYLRWGLHETLVLQSKFGPGVLPAFGIWKRPRAQQRTKRKGRGDADAGESPPGDDGGNSTALSAAGDSGSGSGVTSVRIQGVTFSMAARLVECARVSPPCRR